MPGLPRGADHIDRTAGIPEDGLISLPKLPRMNEVERNAPAKPLGITRTLEASANRGAVQTDCPPQGGGEFTWPERPQ